jgi:hypothetical protein
MPTPILILTVVFSTGLIAYGIHIVRAFRTCRKLGHRWKPGNNELVCSRCGRVPGFRND